MSAFLLARLRRTTSGWLVLNRNYAGRWPNITAKKDTPKNAGAYRKEMGKSDKLLFAQAG
jgi:ferredoxin